MTDRTLTELISTVEKSATGQQALAHVFANIQRRMKEENSDGLDKFYLAGITQNIGEMAGIFRDHTGALYRLTVEKINEQNN